MDTYSNEVFFFFFFFFFGGMVGCRRSQPFQSSVCLFGTRVRSILIGKLPFQSFYHSGSSLVGMDNRRVFGFHRDQAQCI